MGDYDRVLYPTEVESYLDSLQVFDISEIGSNRWFEQSKRIYKLSLQASLDVRSGSDEIVKEEVVVYNKVPVLVHELIAVELWRLKVLPLLLKMESVTKSVIPLYTVLYHEVTLLSFLEIILFHEDVMESAGDTLIDLVDHCYRRIVILKGINPKQITDDPAVNLDDVQRIAELQKKMNFESGIKCVSILSCIVQHKNTVPLSVLHRVLVIHDIPLLFTELICNPQWVRDNVDSGRIEKFLDGHWKKVSPGENMKLSKVEGQLWISLLLLLLDPECQKKYDMNEFRKEQILKLRSKINEILMDQIPELTEMARWLEHLNLFDPSRPKSELIMEQVPEIWEGLKKSNKSKWGAIAEKQSVQIFTMTESQFQDFCRRMGESFDVKHIEAMLPDKPACAQCKDREGVKRCSRCMSEWYCGRPCQVAHWSKHKTACDLLMTSRNEGTKTQSSSK